jgi:hypothetical protein
MTLKDFFNIPIINHIKILQEANMDYDSLYRKYYRKKHMVLTELQKDTLLSIIKKHIQIFES